MFQDVAIVKLKEHNQLSSIVFQLGITIVVISQILQQDVSHIFPWKFGQIGLPMKALDSSHQEDSQTPKTQKISAKTSSN